MYKIRKLRVVPRLLRLLDKRKEKNKKQKKCVSWSVKKMMNKKRNKKAGREGKERGADKSRTVRVTDNIREDKSEYDRERGAKTRGRVNHRAREKCARRENERTIDRWREQFLRCYFIAQSFRSSNGWSRLTARVSQRDNPERILARHEWIVRPIKTWQNKVTCGAN